MAAQTAPLPSSSRPPVCTGARQSGLDCSSRHSVNMRVRRQKEKTIIKRMLKKNTHKDQRLLIIIIPRSKRTGVIFPLVLNFAEAKRQTTGPLTNPSIQYLAVPDQSALGNLFSPSANVELVDGGVTGRFHRERFELLSHLSRARLAVPKDVNSFAS